MSKNPFSRSRRPKDITRVDALPAWIVRGRRLQYSNAFRFRACVVVASGVAFAVIALGCAPSRPIALARVATADAKTQSAFDSDQRVRLDRLHAALAESSTPSLSRGLLVRLAFDEAADLDLFVTDPAQESVYFANSPTRSGGRLIEDRRCDDPSPRIEAVHYPSPLSGRYRVGVDFHGRCEETPLSSQAVKQGLYVVRVEDGERELVREGLVTPGQFEVIVIEFEVE